MTPMTMLVALLVVGVVFAYGGWRLHEPALPAPALDDDDVREFLDTHLGEDDAVLSVVGLAQAGGFEDVRTALAALDDNRRCDAVFALAPHLSDEWVRGLDVDDALHLSLQAAYDFLHAEELRNGVVDDDLDDATRQAWHARIDRAYNAMLEALCLDDEDPVVFATTLAVCISGVPRDDTIDVFMRATELAPSRLQTYLDGLQSLSPKWAGNFDSLDLVVERAEELLGETHPLTFVVAVAHHLERALCLGRAAALASSSTKAANKAASVRHKALFDPAALHALADAYRAVNVDDEGAILAHNAAAMLFAEHDPHGVFDDAMQRVGDVPVARVWNAMTTGSPARRWQRARSHSQQGK